MNNVIPGKTALPIPPNDLAALTVTIGTLLDNPVRARQLGLETREFATKRYPPIEQQYDRWVEVWAGVAHKGKPSRRCN